MYLRMKLRQVFQNQNNQTVKKTLYLIVLLFISFAVRAQRPKDLYLMGMAKIISGQPDSALQYLNSAIIRESDKYQYCMERGKLLFSTGKYGDAIKDFESVNLIRNDFADLWLAKSYASTNQDSIAIYYLKRHLQSAYRSPEKFIKTDKAFNNLQLSDEWFQLWQQDWYTEEEKLEKDVNYLLKNNNFIDAVTLIDEKIPESKNPKPLYIFKAQIESQQGNFRASAMDWTEALSLDRDNINALKQRGIAYLNSEKFKEAYDDFSKALRLDPANFELYILRAKASRGKKDLNSAVKDMDLYLDYFPDDKNAILFCGELNYDNGNYVEALKNFNKDLRLDNSNPEYFKARGKAFYQTKMYKYAIDDLSMSLDLKPDDGEVYYFKGMARYNSGDKQGACSDWKISANYGETRAIEQLINYCQ